MKVLIVGAGAAGITAAHLLAERGIDFTVLEASPVHGGRLRKAADFVDFPIDLGAEWIHRSIRARPPILSGVLDGSDQRYPSFPYRPRAISQYRRGRVRRMNWLRFVLARVDDAKFVDSTWFDVFDRLVTADIQARIRYSTPVAAIDYTGPGVRVQSTAGEELTADQVLVTVPLTMLQNDSIRFTPQLPADKRVELAKERMGDGLKVFMEFEQRFYPDALLVGKLLGDPYSEDAVYYDATQGKRTDRHVLALFAHGAKATRYTELGSEQAIIEYVLGELDQIFHGQASKHLRQHLVQNWSAEPFIQGSYSMRRASPEVLSAPVDGRLFFAGEAMHERGRTVAVHGAADSAYIAVDRMLGPA